MDFHPCLFMDAESATARLWEAMAIVRDDAATGPQRSAALATLVDLGLHHRSKSIRWAAEMEIEGEWGAGALIPLHNAILAEMVRADCSLPVESIPRFVAMCEQSMLVDRARRARAVAALPPGTLVTLRPGQPTPSSPAGNPRRRTTPARASARGPSAKPSAIAAADADAAALRKATARIHQATKNLTSPDADTRGNAYAALWAMACTAPLAISERAIGALRKRYPDIEFNLLRERDHKPVLARG